MMALQHIKRRYAYPVKHGTFYDLPPKRRDYRRKEPLTVCVASLLRWVYGENDVGAAIVTASDRMITAGDVEYEPNQIKSCAISTHCLIMVSGDYVIHSEALVHLQRQLFANQESDPGIIAERYASHIRQIKYRQAVNTVLSPVGLDHDSFYAQQNTLHPDFLARLSNQLQSFQAPETEAIVAGCDNKGVPFIYLVDRDSVVSCHNDVGFVAIGIGAWHAKSILMRAGYVKTMLYGSAAGLTFAAKKAAEIAPGVGRATDMHFICRTGLEPLLPEFKQKIEDVYVDFEKKRAELGRSAFEELEKFLSEWKKPDAK